MRYGHGVVWQPWLQIISTGRFLKGSIRRWQGRFDVVDIFAAVTLISTSTIRPFVMTGCPCIVPTMLQFHYRSHMAHQDLCWSVLLWTQYDGILCWMDSGNPSIKKASSTHLSCFLLHRKTLFQRALAYFIGTLLDGAINASCLRRFWWWRHTWRTYRSNVSQLRSGKWRFLSPYAYAT